MFVSLGGFVDLVGLLGVYIPLLGVYPLALPWQIIGVIWLWDVSPCLGFTPSCLCFIRSFLGFAPLAGLSLWFTPTCLGIGFFPTFRYKGVRPAMGFTLELTKI